MAFDRNEVQDYIRRAAASRGIDPTTALRVIKQESGFNPMATNLSPKEQSYGLMQLNTQGGLGVHALQKGIDIRDPNTWRQQVDFGLDVVKKDGWRQWYGARDVGIGRWDGIGGRPTGGGSDTLAGGAGNDTLGASTAMADAGPKQSNAIGGLGGLGGFTPPPREDGFDTGGLLRALGAALIAGDASVIPGLIQDSQNQRDKAYDRRYDRARDDWMFGVQRQDRMDERADRKDERQLARDWQQQQFQYQKGQDETANSRAERTLTLQEQLANRKAEGYRTLTPDEVKQRGLPPGSYQIGPDGKLDEVGKQGQTINVSTGQDEGEFAKKAAGKQVDRLGAISEGGNAAASVVQTLPQLRELLAVAPQGPIQGRLAETFPGFSTAGDAFGAAVNQIAPTLRVAGSGAASDKDIDLLLGSFPRLRNDPAANTIILDAFQTKARINMERADIANAALRGEIKPGEADRRLQELDRQSIIPEGLRQRLGVTKAPDTGLSQNPRNRPRATNPATGKVIEFDGKAWVPVS